MANLTAAGSSTCITPEQRKRQEGSPIYLNFCTRLHKINMSAFCMTKSEPISLIGMPAWWLDGDASDGAPTRSLLLATTEQSRDLE